MNMLQLFRLFKIYVVIMRQAFTPDIVGTHSPFLKFLTYLNPWRIMSKKQTRGVSIRVAFEKLGPIFVKFGQLLSTRRDVLPEDIIIELEKLQDRVPPFSGKIAKKIIENAFNKPINEIFIEFDEIPLASASIAQVHPARLPDGQEIIVKVLRPNNAKLIRHDIALMYLVASISERLFLQARRLRLIELVAEFEQTINYELDLNREAANASQLRNNFKFSNKLYVPKIYWQYTRSNVMVMERIYGIPIAQIEILEQHHTNFKKLAENGVEIFFTQVFRDSFFHADMHPGNLFVDVSDPENPQYIGVDFGIMGSLSDSDKYYIAANLVAFFKRDYRQVAVLHVESGWVPADTRIDQFESAIRTVCEPIFERPLKQISFGQLLVKLFQTAKLFNMQLQPQFMLLQKTLLNVESLGRRLYPDLNLWNTAKPFMIKWMRERNSPRYLIKTFVRDWQHSADRLIKAPRLMLDILQEVHSSQQRMKATHQAEKIKYKRTRLVRGSFLLGGGIALLIVGLFYALFHHPHFQPPLFVAITSGIGLLLILFGWLKI